MKLVKIDKADLHIHTSASDGEYSPEKVVDVAHELGINSIAITDHDTVDGVKSVIAYGKKKDIEVIPGIELSVNYPGVLGSIHLLGLYIDYNNEILINYIKKLKEYREERNYKIFWKLEKLGFDIKEDDFPNILIQNLGRPHIAKKLVEKGYVDNLNIAFEHYLKKGAKAYVNKKRYYVEEGIDFIHSICGLAIMAHPYTLKLNTNQLDVFLRYLKKSCKLDGLEVFYPEHSPRFVDMYYQLAKKLFFRNIKS